MLLCLKMFEEKVQEDKVNFPQFNGHSEKGYHGLEGVFDEQTSVQDIQQGIQDRSS